MTSLVLRLNFIYKEINIKSVFRDKKKNVSFIKGS